MDDVRFRPRHSLFRRGVAAFLAFSVPATAVLLILTVPDGPWPVVVGGAVVLSLAFVYGVVSYQRLGVWVSAERITERGFFGKSSTLTHSQIGSIIIADVFPGGTASETVPNLFICDLQGWQVIRLRGQFWPRETMDAILAELDAPLTEIDRPISTSELYATYPGLLYWFERRPLLSLIHI